MVLSYELSMIVKYCGTDAINDYTLIDPIVHLLAIGVSRCLAQSADTYIQRNIAK